MNLNPLSNQPLAMRRRTRPRSSTTTGSRWWSRACKTSWLTWPGFQQYPIDTVTHLRTLSGNKKVGLPASRRGGI